MPQYFFSVRNLEPHDTPIAWEFANDEAAWQEATHFASDIFRDIDGRLRLGQEWAVEVTDEAGRPVFSINVSAKSRRG